MRYRLSPSKAGAVVLSMGLLFAGTGSVSAQESGSADPWKFKAALYLWGAAIDGTTRGGNEFDASFSDIWDNLDFAFMGAFEARKGKWSVAADVIYMDVSADRAGTIGPRNAPVSADLDLTGWVFNFQGARNVYEHENASVDVLLGARYLDLESKLTVTTSGFFGSRTSEASGDVWDGIVGVKGQINVSKSWFLPYHLDIGTGQSDATWQVLGGVGYAFKHVDLILAYRYLAWNFDSDSQLEDMNLSGPLFGAVFKF